MSICVNGYVTGDLISTSNVSLISSKVDSNTSSYHCNIYKDKESIFKKLMDFLKDEGYFFYGNIQATINISPTVNKAINVVNVSHFLLSQSFKVELPDYTYLVSPFLKNKDILQEFKKCLLLQLMTENYFVFSASDHSKNSLLIDKDYDSETNDLVQYLVEQEKRREFVIFDSVPLNACFRDLKVNFRNKSSAISMGTSLKEAEYMSLSSCVSLTFTIPIITQSFEPFKVIMLNTKETITHLGQRILNMEKILTDPTIISTFETETDKEKNNVKVIGSSDFSSFQI